MNMPFENQNSEITPDQQLAKLPDNQQKVLDEIKGHLVRSYVGLVARGLARNKDYLEIPEFQELAKEKLEIVLSALVQGETSGR